MYFSLPTARLIFCVLCRSGTSNTSCAKPSGCPVANSRTKTCGGRRPRNTTEQQVQEMISKLQGRVKKAADSVLGRIQKEEDDVHFKFTYLRKPERLDPNQLRVQR